MVTLSFKNINFYEEEDVCLVVYNAIFEKIEMAYKHNITQIVAYNALRDLFVHFPPLSMNSKIYKRRWTI